MNEEWINATAEKLAEHMENVSEVPVYIQVGSEDRVFAGMVDASGSRIALAALLRAVVDRLDG